MSIGNVKATVPTKISGAVEENARNGVSGELMRSSGRNVGITSVTKNTNVVIGGVSTI